MAANSQKNIQIVFDNIGEVTRFVNLLDKYFKRDFQHPKEFIRINDNVQQCVCLHLDKNNHFVEYGLYGISDFIVSRENLGRNWMYCTSYEFEQAYNKIMNTPISQL